MQGLSYEEACYRCLRLGLKQFDTADLKKILQRMQDSQHKIIYDGEVCERRIAAY